MPDSRAFAWRRSFPSGPRLASLQKVLDALGQFLGSLDTLTQSSLRVLDFSDVVDVFLSHNPIPLERINP